MDAKAASERLLLESFSRPENAIASAVDAAADFLREHSARLAAVKIKKHNT